MAAPPSYADSVSDTASSLSSLSDVGYLRDFGSPTIYRGRERRPSRSSSADSGYFETLDLPSTVAPPVNPRLNSLLDAYRRVRLEAEYYDLIGPFTEIWLVANAARSREDPNVTWPGDLVETRVAEAWSALVGAYSFLDDSSKLSTKTWGDLEDTLLHLKIEIPYIHSLKDWMKRLLKRNENTHDCDTLVFLPGYRSKHPASAAWKKWENMAHEMGQHVEREGTRRFVSGNFKFFAVEYVDREQFGSLKSAMRRLLMTVGMAESVNLRSEALLSYRA